MSTQLYWGVVSYLIAMVTMACASYNFMCTKAPGYEIEVTFPVKVMFLGGALIMCYNLWMTVKGSPAKEASLSTAVPAE